MDRATAERKYRTLCLMTTARGCTVHEADTAHRLAAALAARFGFGNVPPATHWRPDFEQRFERAEQRAAGRFAWEYRRCGKSRCWCARARRKTHGPYRYGKKRIGRKVVSLYIGR